jgi:trk system potassium uptake protein
VVISSATGVNMRPVRSPRALLRALRRRWHELSPPATLALSFALLIAEGTAGMLLIPGLHAGERLSFVDALFTMTSAVCVTGLIVVDTATAFTRLGQLWIIAHVQLGGIGLITLTTLVIGAMGQRLSLRSEMVVAGPVDFTHRLDVRTLVLAVTRFMLAVELAGMFALFALFAPRLGVVEGAWHAVFHAISAFCNAGFSTFSESLAPFATQPAVIVVVSVLVILGGFGYLALEEAVHWWRARGSAARRRLSVHTFAALVTTVTLLGAGTVLYALFEWNGVLVEFRPLDRLVNAWFMSVTSRTAGFNTIPYSDVSNSSAFLTILLMLVGGSPGSAAGGVKTTAVAVLVALAVGRMRGREHIQIHDRTIPKGTIERTVSLTLIAFAAVTAAMFLLEILESHGQTRHAQRADFLPTFFEVVSAFGTVGLSMGVTPDLSPAAKVLVVLMMFLGRIGPLAFFAAISLRARTDVRGVRTAQEDLIVG